MKKQLYFLATNIALVSTILFCVQCSKTDSSNMPAMTITSISPTTVQAGSLTEVSVTGTNFEPSVASMLINVGGMNIAPNSATATVLKFNVPSTASVGTQKIELINHANNSQKSVKSEQDLTITAASVITITNISPNTFSLSNPNFVAITVSGSGFNADKSKMVISLGRNTLGASSSSPTSLTFMINNMLPSISVGTFKIGIKNVSTSNDEVKSTQDFTITP